jgi:putative oxidoreductase
MFGRLLLRAAIAAVFFEHGTQKLFGWFGGGGPDGTGQFFESLGLRPGRRIALATGATEVTGGTLVAAGFVTPVGAAALSAVMLGALRTAVWPNGYKAGTGELEVMLLASAVALAETGPGELSLDAALGRELRGPAGAGAAVAAGAASAGLMIAAARRQPPPPRPEQQQVQDEPAPATADARS